MIVTKHMYRNSASPVPPRQCHLCLC